MSITEPKRRNKELDEVTKGRIIQSHEEGNSIRSIATRMGIGCTQVHNLLVNFRTTGSTDRSSKSGRPRKTSPRDDRKIILTMKANRSMSSAEVLDESGVENIGTNTVI